MKTTAQMEVWSGEFGRAYTERNDWTLDELRERVRAYIGHDPLTLYEWLLEDVPRSTRVLEVGCNVGMQLECLAALGFERLHGLELQGSAVEKVRLRLPEAEITKGSALDLPYEADSFGLVYTSGVLIHIAPADRDRVLDEICRCSSMWIMGIEYYAETLVAAPYRGRGELMWKDDFERLYRERHPRLETVRSRRLPLSADPSLEDTYFLLTGAGSQ